MGDLYLQGRLDFLSSTQNPDGGWGYFPGKQSWLEPTVYSMFATGGNPRAWALIDSWQLPDGGWKPAAQVHKAHGASALCVLLHCVNRRLDDHFHNGVGWLLGSAGAEGGVLPRVLRWMGKSPVDYDPSLIGWPWLPDTSSWVEPTAQAMLALKKAAPFVDVKERSSLNARVKTGEQMLLERRCTDGGWNYGNRRVFKTDLPSFPETTAVALIGLQGVAEDKLATSATLAERYWRESNSPLAKAWLRICLRKYTDQASATAPRDILLAALECCGAAQQNPFSI